MGINPEGLLLNALGSAVTTQYSDPSIRIFFLILPTLILVISVIGAYMNGKVPGLVAVLVAYAAGLVILSSVITGLVLLGASIVLAYHSTSSRGR
jgi:uncharacterized membrane protein (DUF485 family)